MLRDDPGIRKNRHEVAVTGPTRHDMHVDVRSDSGPCGLAEIPADIETLGTADVTQNTLAEDHEAMQFLYLRRVQVGRVGEMTIRRDQEVAV